MPAGDASRMASDLVTAKAEAGTHPPPSLSDAAIEYETHRIGLPYLSILAFAVGIVTGLGADGVPEPDRFRAQSVVPRAIRLPVRRQPVHAAQPVGTVGHSRAGDRGGGRHVSRDEVRARGTRAWRARDHGRHLLPGRRHPPGRRPREVASLGYCDRQRGGGRAGGPDHSDRLGARLDFGPGGSHSAGAAHQARGGRCGSRDRGDVQHADRRRHVCGRADDAGSQCPDLSAGGDRDRNRDLYRPPVFWRAAGFHRAAAAARQH
jgi:hypothetical protein